MRVPQTQDELKRHFQEQFYFLIASCNSYDAGFEAEAKRLAVTIRTLVHDTEKSKSLLSSLGLKDELEWCDSVGEVAPGVSFRLGVAIQLSTNPSAMRYKPILSEPKQRISFQQWWDGIIVFDKAKKVSISRKSAVRNLANKDGGAHIDPYLNQEYTKVSRQNGLSYTLTTISSEGTKAELIETNLILAIVRQIAHEVKLTIQEHMALPSNTLQQVDTSSSATVTISNIVSS